MVRLKKHKSLNSENNRRIIRKKKDSKKKEVAITILLAGLMIFSIFAIMMGGYNSQEITEEYNGYKFELVTINNQNLWRVEVNDEIKTFSYSPSQLENINLSEEEKSLFKTNLIGIKFNPEDKDIGNIELFRSYLAQELTAAGKQVFFSVSTNMTEGYETFPVYGCNESIPLVQLEIISDASSENSNIKQDQYCVIVNSRVNDIIPIAERLIYLSLGIME